MTVAAKRAIRAFPMAGDPWASVDRWAASQGYHVVEQDGGRRVYKKGTGFLVAARKVEITADGGGLRVEAYVAANAVARAFALFLIPSEITVEPGGVQAVIPRNMGRSEVNALLKELNQAPIA
jgi:hypothetical protein